MGLPPTFIYVASVPLNPNTIGFFIQVLCAYYFCKLLSALAHICYPYMHCLPNACTHYLCLQPLYPLHSHLPQYLLTFAAATMSLPCTHLLDILQPHLRVSIRCGYFLAKVGQ